MAVNMVMSSTLDLFKKPETDYSIESYRMVTIQPTTTGINPMEFIVPKLESFVDLNRSYFTMELQMKRVMETTGITRKLCGPLTTSPTRSSNRLICT